MLVEVEFPFHELSLQQSHGVGAPSQVSSMLHVPQWLSGASNVFSSHLLHPMSLLTSDNVVHSPTSYGSSHSSVPTHMHMSVHIPMPMHLSFPNVYLY